MEIQAALTPISKTSTKGSVGVTVFMHSSLSYGNGKEERKRESTFLLETCPSVSDRRLQKQVHAHVLVIATEHI